ncbi:ribosomal protection-like ABC-F family protein [Clostridium sp. KNHs214]|uniref:ribosomal protection-like ABC-F family protein n=1 Tax=Clostridium sp. KNHs214 TaxID=1540257 RepID=UPI0005578BD2|nr:ABC-F family ATP-binding cassette domain-containing protein [Clostridium sp. KNHs214]
MSILSIENLSFGFADKILFKDISLNILNGEHAGLVGINGVGKSTLFNIIVGELIPDEGRVYKSASTKIGYLDQHSELEDGKTIREVLKESFSELYAMEAKMLKVGDKLSRASEVEMEKLLKEFSRLQDALSASDFYNIDSYIENVANGLGLSHLGMETPVEKLSGGQRTKVKLAKLLLTSYDLLLLDEPTNYLDKEHVDWLAGYLQNYAKSFVVISHDTAFINNITNVIYHLQFAALKRYPGNYEKFLKLSEDETQRYMQEYQKQQKEIKKLQDYIDKNKVRASTSKMALSRQKKLDKIERIEKPKTPPKPYFSFLEARKSGKLIFESNSMDIGYRYPIIKNLNLKLTRGEKVAITGCNGIGKSTLLKTLMGVISPLHGDINFGVHIYPSYFEQEVKPKDITPIDEVWNEYPEKTQAEIREALGKCGLKREHIMQNMCALSGGEQAKVRLCKLMMKESNWLVLDEPTNHLDVSAKEILKEALINFGGTVLLVCHEREFYKDWVTAEWNMEEYCLGK